jgi:phosphatidylglycerol:prolipoprotein diacylglycerol transferase
MIWNIDPIAFSLPDLLGGREIRYYGLLYMVALMGAYLLWRWQVLRSGRTHEQAERFLSVAFAAVIMGARVGHCVFYNPTYYLAHPWEILKVWEGGLASHGATVTLILTLVYFARTEGMLIRDVFDRFAIGVAWAASIIRLGNLMNSEIVGRVIPNPSDALVAFKFPLYERALWGSCSGCATSSLPDCVQTARGCVDLAQVPWRHPSQIYEFLMGMVIFGALLWVDSRYKEGSRPVGLLGGLFLVLYFTARFIVEFFKEFQALTDGRSALTMGQYLSVPFILIGGAMIAYGLRERAAGATDTVAR